MLRPLLVAALAASLVASFGARATAAPVPTAEIMAPVEATLAAFNAFKPDEAQVNFTADATVVSKFAPYRYTGPSAARAWLVGVHSAYIGMRAKNVTATIGQGGSVARDHDNAYVSVPVTVTYSIGPQNERISGLWAFTLTRAGGSWKITSATFAVM